MSEDISIRKPTGSPIGLVIMLAIGFAFYFVFSRIGGALGGMMTYDGVITGITASFPQQVQWLLMNFTEPQFYAGMLAGLGVMAGGFIAWRLAVAKSKYAGFDVCYGQSNLWPWVFASQVISAGLAIFVFRYINLFDTMDVAWVPTFVSIVGAPPSVVLLYGKSVPALITGSILGGLLSAPVATWLSTYVTATWNAPGVVPNVLAMAITGVLICSICRVLPWVKKVEYKSHRDTPKPAENVYTPFWFMRRVTADFSEAQFYGNEIASLVLLSAVTIEWVLSPGLVSGGSGMLPAIILSQFVASSVGVFLYANKFENNGWYGTYVPVVSVGPACVLFFGGGIHIALVAGVLGGIIGAPFAEFLQRHWPEGIHPTSANVTAMAISTIIVAFVIRFIGLA